MFQIVFAWKSHSTNAVPDVVYAGPSGDERAKAVAQIAGKGYVRAVLLVNPTGVPVAIPETEEEIAKRQAEAAAAIAQREEAKRKAQIAEAEAEFQRVHDQLHALKNPAPPTAQDPEAPSEPTEPEKPKASKKPKK